MTATSTMTGKYTITPSADELAAEQAAAERRQRNAENRRRQRAEARERQNAAHDADQATPIGDDITDADAEAADTILAEREAEPTPEFSTATDAGITFVVKRPQFPVSVDGETPEDYAVAPDLRTIADWMIDTYPELRHLQGKAIAYLWKREGGKAAGVPKFGSSRVANGRDRFAFHALFIVEIADDHTAAAEYTPAHFERELFHQLCHLGVKIDDRTDEETPTRRPHDFEGFAEEIARYGAWRSDLATVQTIFQQARMDLGDASRVVSMHGRR